jgi:Ferritin-like domain
MNTSDLLPTKDLGGAPTGDVETASRRKALFRGATLVAGAGLAFATILEPTRALADDSDASLLNALLAAEWSAIAAYTAGAGYLAAPAGTDPMVSAAPTVLAVAKHFLSQHQDHATQLGLAVTSAGGTPVAQASVTFTVPTGWTASVLNVLKLAANAEKAAAVAYTETLKQVSAATASQLVAAIGGVETQHFTILSLLVLGIAAPTAATLSMASDVVPRSFTASPAAGVAGLETVPDFTYAA